MNGSRHALFESSERFEVITTTPSPTSLTNSQDHGNITTSREESDNNNSVPQSPLYTELYKNLKKVSSSKKGASRKSSKQYKIPSLTSTAEADESLRDGDMAAYHDQAEASGHSLDIYKKDDSQKDLEPTVDEFRKICSEVAMTKSNNYSDSSLDFAPLIPCINFIFRDMKKELGFLNYLALSRRDLITLGYALQITMSFVGLGLFGIVQVAIPNRAAMCEGMIDKLAEKIEKEEEIEIAESLKRITCDLIVEDVSLDDTNFGKVMRQGAMLFAALAAFLVIVWLLQVYLYRSSRIKNKAWVLLVVNAQYAVQMWLSPVAVYVMQRHYWCDCEKGQKFWPLNIFLFYNFALFFATWFAGLATLQLLLNSVVGLTLYYYFTIEALRWERLTSEPLSYWISSSVLEHTISFNVILALLMLICAYINEKAARNTFVNRITLYLQNKKITKQRERNDKLQNALMESILPHFVVQAVQRGHFSLENPAENLSQHHEGVSILFAGKTVDHRTS